MLTPDEMKVLEKNPKTSRFPMYYAIVAIILGVAMMVLQVRREWAGSEEAIAKAEEARHKERLAKEQLNQKPQHRSGPEIKTETQTQVPVPNEGPRKPETELPPVEPITTTFQPNHLVPESGKPTNKRQGSDKPGDRVEQKKPEPVEVNRPPVKTPQSTTNPIPATEEVTPDVPSAEKELREKAKVGTEWKIKSPINNKLTQKDGSEPEFEILAKFQQDEIVKVLEAPDEAIRLKIGRGTRSGWLLWSQFDQFLSTN